LKDEKVLPNHLQAMTRYYFLCFLNSMIFKYQTYLESKMKTNGFGNLEEADKILREAFEQYQKPLSGI
jgi:inorganic pyrophosphatase